MASDTARHFPFFSSFRVPLLHKNVEPKPVAIPSLIGKPSYHIIPLEPLRRERPLGISRNRAGGIRTHDLLNPIQAHYQAVLQPVLEQWSIVGWREGCKEEVWKNSPSLHDLLQVSFTFEATRLMAAALRGSSGEAGDGLEGSDRVLKINAERRDRGSSRQTQCPIEEAPLREI